jgi:hypothetical protein
MAILSDIIINEKLKLLQINYLARKVDFCLIFLLGHIVLVTEPNGKTMYNHQHPHYPVTGIVKQDIPISSEALSF